MAQNLQEFLGSLQEGQLQSQGSFTLSADRASDLLESYSLVDPGLYVVELVAAAVASGAGYCEVTSGTRGCSIRFDGQPFTAEQVEQASALVYAGSGSYRTRSLALALTAARGLAAEHLRVTVSDAHLTARGDGWERETPDQPPAFTQVELRRPLQLLSSWLGSNKKLREMLEVCRLAPLKLSFNGEEIYGYFWPEGYGSATCGCLQLQGPFPRPSLRSYNGFEKHVQAADGEEFSASIFVVPPRQARQTGLTVVLNGVAYRGDGEPLDNPCLCGALLTGGLKTNLSRTGVVQDQSFLDMVSTLKQHSQDLLVDLITGPLAYSRILLEVVPGIQHLRDQFEAAGDPRLERVKAWLGSVEERAAEEEQGLKELRAEALRLEGSGQAAEAQELRLRLLERELEGLARYSYDQDRSLRTGRELRWTLKSLEPESYRVKQVHEFSTLCLSLEDSVPIRADLPPESRALLLRLRGDSAGALQAYLESSDRNAGRQRAEIYLSQGDPSAARPLLLQNLVLESTEALPPDYWGGDCEDLDLMADLLELEGDYRRSLEFRSCACHRYSNPSLLYLRRLELARAAQGRTSFIEWVGYRSRASFSGLSAVLGGWRRPIPRLLKKLWTRGRWLPEEEEVRHEFAVFFKANYLWTGLILFLAGRLAQRFRLEGAPRRAESCLARAGILARVARLRDLLRRGQAE